MPVVVVTDSTAILPPEVAAERGIVVVPLQVVIGATSTTRAPTAPRPELVAEALRECRPVSTSRPAPAAMLEVYERPPRRAPTAIVSVHLSGEMSGTFESAQLAARDASVPVLPVDTRQVGVATGYAALAAADVLDARRRRRGGGRGGARRGPTASTSLFYVDTLEYLRRGGRIGAAAALFGGALAVKPLLQIDDGRVATLEKVRTVGPGAGPARGAGRRRPPARRRSTSASPTSPAPTGPAQLAEQLAERLADNLEGREVWCGELGAVLGAHVGPGHARGLRRAARPDASRFRPQRRLRVAGFSTGRAGTAARAVGGAS